MLLCTKCGTQPILDTLWSLALLTKTPLAVSHFLGRWCLSLSILLHVLSTRFSGRAFLLYLFLLVRVLSWLSLQFMVDMIWFLASLAVIVSWWPGSRILLHLSFHMRNAHLETVIRKRQVAPWWVLPVLVLTFRSGRAMIVVVSRLCSQGMFFLLQISLVVFQMRSHWFALHLNRM